LFSQDLNISNWSWAPLDKRKLFQGIISVLFVEAPSIDSKQNYETNVNVWSAHCKTTKKKHKCKLCDLWVQVAQHFDSVLPPSNHQYWFHEVVSLCYHGVVPMMKKFCWLCMGGKLYPLQSNFICGPIILGGFNLIWVT
jgi:hypothetical protein